VLPSFVSSRVTPFARASRVNGLAARMGKTRGVHFASSREEQGRGAISLLLPFAKFFSNDHEKT
jgi:hypothetical protein